MFSVCGRLGHEVTLVEPITVPAEQTDAAFVASDAAAYFRRLVADFGLENSAALVRSGSTATVGLPHDELARRRSRRHPAQYFGHAPRSSPDRTSAPACIPRPRSGVQPDVAGAGHRHALDQHSHFATIAWNIGQTGCTVPTCGRQWITTPQPVVLDRWPVATEIAHDGLTTVAHWRSYGSVTYDGIFHGQKAHAWRELMALPTLTAEKCLPAARDPSRRGPRSGGPSRCRLAAARSR